MVNNVTFVLSISLLRSLRVKILKVEQRKIMSSVNVSSFQLQDDQQFDLVFEADDKAGNKTALDSNAVIEVATSDPEIVTITLDPTGKATVSSVGKIGTAQVSVKATIGSEVLTGSLTVDVVPGSADHLTLTPSAPVSKP